MRNRLSNIDARNKRFMTQLLNDLSRRIGFRVAPGFSERVIFRELFLQGLTVLDVMDVDSNINVSLSHVAARQEVRDLLKVLNIEKVNQRIDELKTKEKKPKKAAAAAKPAETATAEMKEADETAEKDKKAEHFTGNRKSDEPAASSAIISPASISPSAEKKSAVLEAVAS